jgi:DNA-binding transcriptional LysR family regulator
MLNLYKLEVFNTVALEGSFSKAARRLLLTQPAVSQHIRDLEIHLKSELFQRSPQGVTLTQAGEVLLDYTRCILRMLVDAEDAILSLNNLSGAQIVLGATPGAGVHLLPAWIKAFQSRYPQARVRLSTATTGTILTEILTSRIDAGFVEGEFKEEPPLQVLPLMDIDLYLVVGPQHPWSGQDSVPLSALEGEPFISRPSGSQTRAWIDRTFSEKGTRLNVVAEFDQPEAIAGAVASGMGITVLPKWGLGGNLNLKTLTIEGLPLKRTLKLVWSHENPFGHAMRAFLALLTDQFPNLVDLVSPSDIFSPLPARENYRASLTCVSQFPEAGARSDQDKPAGNPRVIKSAAKK